LKVVWSELPCGTRNAPTYTRFDFCTNGADGTAPGEAVVVGEVVVVVGGVVVVGDVVVVVVGGVVVVGDVVVVVGGVVVVGDVVVVVGDVVVVVVVEAVLLGADRFWTQSRYQ
jgi:hypothetical protein